MNIKDIPKKYKEFKVVPTHSRSFVATWTAKRLKNGKVRPRFIYLNQYYIKLSTVSIEDVKAILLHEYTEYINYTQKHLPMIISHGRATKAEKAYIIKHLGKHAFPQHQKEVIETYRNEATTDAPFMDLRDTSYTKKSNYKHISKTQGKI